MPLASKKWKNKVVNIEKKLKEIERDRELGQVPLCWWHQLKTIDFKLTLREIEFFFFPQLTKPVSLTIIVYFIKLNVSKLCQKNLYISIISTLKKGLETRTLSITSKVVITHSHHVTFYLCVYAGLVRFKKA